MQLIITFIVITLQTAGSEWGDYQQQQQQQQQQQHSLFPKQVGVG